jgi:squalene cyclase
MQLQLDANGFIPASYPRKFYRVECWDRGRRIADFDNCAEAHRFAIRHAKENGYRYDHKVATCQMTRD